jgi:hypothetical protein
MRQQQTVETPRPRGGNALSGSGPGSGSGSGSGFAPAHQIIEPRTLPLDAPNRDPGSSDRSQLGTLSPGEEALRSESGAKMQPVPQRDLDRGEGLPYTKRVSRPNLPHMSLFLVLIVGA